ncbi:MAG: phage major capsid protein [Gammaproteobacteria bacterium]|nr:MAG: phage major capsid protein [Gammaproteobacteria bacterium]
MTKIADDDLKCFDEEQRKVLLRIQRDIEEAAHKKDTEEEELFPVDPRLAKDAARVKKVRAIWENNGFIDGLNQRVTLPELLEKDAEYREKMLADGFSTDHPLLIPRVISNMVRDAIEPALNLTPLLQRINFTAGRQLVIPAFGAIYAADIPEGGEYPERELELGGEVVATIGKSGVAVKVSEETVRYSQFDVLSILFRKAGQALARHKEKKVADLITTNGVTVIDNTDPNVRSSTGMNAAGQFNGTLTLDDLMYAYGKMVDSGFTPNALIMHPLAWQIFGNEGIARAFGFENGLASLMWQAAQGSPGSAPQWRVGGLNQNTYVSSPGQIATTRGSVPSIFPVPLRVIVSPFMSFDSSTKRTTLALVDTNELGLLVVDEELFTEDWDVPQRDLRKVKFRERYGLAVVNEGKGIALMKDIFVGSKSFDFSDKLVVNVSHGTVSGDLSSITGDSPKGSV